MINAPVDLTQSEIITAYAVLCLQMIHSYRKVRDKENGINTVIRVGWGEASFVDL